MASEGAVMDTWHKLSKTELPQLLEDRLAGYGFVMTEEGWLYQKMLPECGLELKVLLHEGEMFSQLMDNETSTPYALHLVDAAQGAYVGQVRSEYEEALADMARECSVHGSNQEGQLAEILELIRSRYHDEVEYPWEDHDSFVVRHPKTGKWYALFMLVMPKQIGLAGQQPLRVMNLHGTPEEVTALVDGERFLPGYHMNKKTWYTICLDGSVPLRDISDLLERSYKLAAGDGHAEEQARRVLEIVAQIPRGKVATYGQIAELAGMPKRARLVGKIMGQAEKYGTFPCHRVVNSSGRLVPGWAEQGNLLSQEGIVLKDTQHVSLKYYQWEGQMDTGLERNL